MKTKILEKIHNIRGSLNVVLGFMMSIDVNKLNPDKRELYEACKLSLEKIERNLVDLQILISRTEIP